MPKALVKARLSDDEVHQIVDMLTSWKGPLSWENLTAKVDAFLGRTFSRQGLDKIDIIATAFKQAKKRLRTRPKKQIEKTSLTPELDLAQRRIDGLSAEVKVLEAERERLLEQFATWLYNARSRGLSEFDLDRPLPAIDRDSSERKR